MTTLDQLVSKAKALREIGDPDAWEKAVEDLLLDLAEAVGAGVMRQEDYTRKTQALAAERRAIAEGDK